MIIAFNKPHGVLSQFTPDHPGQRTLAEFGFPPGVYPAGRLDMDSEGLLLLTDEAALVDRLLNPRHGHARRYLVQVEGEASMAALEALEAGVVVAGRRTAPCRVWIPDPPPSLPERIPPIRRRMAIPTTWLLLELTEGRNRQVRRMTAAVGLPTLRLVRVQVGILGLDLAQGAWRVLDDADRVRALQSPARHRG